MTTQALSTSQPTDLSPLGTPSRTEPPNTLVPGVGEPLFHTAAGPLSHAEEHAILHAIQNYATGFIRADMGMLLGLWDAGPGSALSYVETESDQPLYDLNSLRAYYQGLLNNLIVQSGDVSEVRIFRTGPDQAYAFCIYNWVVKPKAGGPSMTQPTRATFLLHKRNGRWLYQHFHESIRFNVPSGTLARSVRG